MTDLRDRPLTDRQRQVLEVLRAHSETEEGRLYGLPANTIGHRIGFRTGSDRHAHDGRMMGAANRVNGSLQGLERRGLVGWGPRRDGLSGTAFKITQPGLEALGV